MLYTDGYKFQLEADEVFQTEIHPSERVETEHFTLDADGRLTVKRDFAWDGATMAFDVKSIRRGSCAHDALYRMMRQRLLEQRWRPEADLLLRQICQDDGMNRAGVWWVYHMVRSFGDPFADPRNERPVLSAP